MIFHCFILVVIFPVSFSSVFHCQIWASLLFFFNFIFFSLASVFADFAQVRVCQFSFQIPRIANKSDLFLLLVFFFIFRIFSFASGFATFVQVRFANLGNYLGFISNFQRGKNRGLFRSHFPRFFFISLSFCFFEGKGGCPTNLLAEFRRSRNFLPAANQLGSPLSVCLLHDHVTGLKHFAVMHWVWQKKLTC